MKLFQNKKIYTDDSPLHGRGVFASDIILPGEIVEQCHVVHPSKKTAKNIDENFLKYFFLWPCLPDNWQESVKEKGTLDFSEISYPVCVLGYGMIYNHSPNPNVIFELDTQNNLIEFRAKRKILTNEELLISYGGDFKLE